MKSKEYVLVQDIIIPAGTKLDRMPENKGGIHRVGTIVGIGKNFAADFSVTVSCIEDAEGYIIELI